MGCVLERRIGNGRVHDITLTALEVDGRALSYKNVSALAVHWLNAAEFQLFETQATASNIAEVVWPACYGMVTTIVRVAWSLDLIVPKSIDWITFSIGPGNPKSIVASLLLCRLLYF